MQPKQHPLSLFGNSPSPRPGDKYFLPNHSNGIDISGKKKDLNQNQSVEPSPYLYQTAFNQSQSEPTIVGKNPPNYISYASISNQSSEIQSAVGLPPIKLGSPKRESAFKPNSNSDTSPKLKISPFEIQEESPTAQSAGPKLPKGLLTFNHDSSPINIGTSKYGYRTPGRDPSPENKLRRNPIQSLSKMLKYTEDNSKSLTPTPSGSTALDSMFAKDWRNYSTVNRSRLNPNDTIYEKVHPQNPWTNFVKEYYAKGSEIVELIKQGKSYVELLDLDKHMTTQMPELTFGDVLKRGSGFSQEVASSLGFAQDTFGNCNLSSARKTEEPHFNQLRADKLDSADRENDGREKKECPDKNYIVINEDPFVVGGTFEPTSTRKENPLQEVSSSFNNRNLDRKASVKRTIPAEECESVVGSTIDLNLIKSEVQEREDPQNAQRVISEESFLENNTSKEYEIIHRSAKTTRKKSKSPEPKDSEEYYSPFNEHASPRSDRPIINFSMTSGSVYKNYNIDESKRNLSGGLNEFSIDSSLKYDVNTSFNPAGMNFDGLTSPMGDLTYSSNYEQSMPRHSANDSHLHSKPSQSSFTHRKAPIMAQISLLDNSANSQTQRAPPVNVLISLLSPTDEKNPNKGSDNQKENRALKESQFEPPKPSTRLVFVSNLKNDKKPSKSIAPNPFSPDKKQSPRSNSKLVYDSPSKDTDSQQLSTRRYSINSSAKQPQKTSRTSVSSSNTKPSRSMTPNTSSQKRLAAHRA